MSVSTRLFVGLSLLSALACAIMPPQDSMSGASCYNADGDPAPCLTISFDVDPSTGEPVIELPDGSVTSSYEEYESAMADLFAENPDAVIELLAGDNVSSEMAEAFGYAPDTGSAGAYAKWATGIPGTKFYISGGWREYYHGYPAECMRDDKPYVAFRLHYDGRQVFNFHFQVFTDPDGSTCFGVYQSQDGLLHQGCWIYQCGPDNVTKEQIRDIVYQAMIAAGAGAATALAVAKMVGPYLLFSL